MRRAEPASETATAAGMLAQRRRRPPRSLGSAVAEQRARAGSGCRLGLASAARIFSSALAPSPASAAQLLRLGGRLQSSSSGRDAELLPEPPRRLRAEPGQPHEERRPPAGTAALRFVSAWISPSRRSGRSSPRSSCRCPAAPSPRPSSASCATDAARLADPRGRAAVGDDAEGVRALELEQVGEQVELVGEIGVPRAARATPAIIRAAPMPADARVVCLPTYNERENLERMVRALAGCCATATACS